MPSAIGDWFSGVAQLLSQSVRMPRDFASAATAARSCCSNVIEFGLSQTMSRVLAVSARSKFAMSVPSSLRRGEGEAEADEEPAGRLWPAPVAIGAHPYLRIGDVPADELTLTVRAGLHFETDERLNVTGESRVEVGGPLDFSAGRRVSELELNDGFGELESPIRHELAADDGRRVVLWSDDAFGYVQLFTHRSFATKQPGEVALAIEPMTAPTNALNSGRGLRWLEPGETWTAVWGIRPEGFAADAYLASWG